MLLLPVFQTRQEWLIGAAAVNADVEPTRTKEIVSILFRAGGHMAFEKPSQANAGALGSRYGNTELEIGMRM
jgi:hypothetical protein